MSDNKELLNDDIVFCRRCNRKLNDEKSKRLGFGPYCYMMWKREQKNKHALFDIQAPNKGEGDIDSGKRV